MRKIFWWTWDGCLKVVAWVGIFGAVARGSQFTASLRAVKKIKSSSLRHHLYAVISETALDNRDPVTARRAAQVITDQYRKALAYGRIARSTREPTDFDTAEAAAQQIEDTWVRTGELGDIENDKRLFLTR